MPPPQEDRSKSSLEGKEISIEKRGEPEKKVERERRVVEKGEEDRKLLRPLSERA